MCGFIWRSIQPVEPLKALYTSAPGRPFRSDTNSTSLGGIQPHHDDYREDYSLSFPPLSKGRYTAE